MYFPRNWEFGSALSKLQNFGGGGVEHPNPPSVRHRTERMIINQKNHKLTGAWQFFGVKISVIYFIVLYYFPDPFRVPSEHCKPINVLGQISLGKKGVVLNHNKNGKILRYYKGIQNYS
jgi:hypothetical protein